MRAYFDWVNARGGVGGRDIVLVDRDDSYWPPFTVPAVDELIASGDVLSITNLGSPTTFAVYDIINQACVPHPFAQTGHPAWGDPALHPWTTGLQLSYSTEAVIWGSYIEATTAPGVKVGALVMDNDFGTAYEGAFRDFANASAHIGDVVFVRHDPTDDDLSDELAQIAASGPDVFIAMTAGLPCFLALVQGDLAGLQDMVDLFFMPSVCVNISAYLAPAGEAAEGVFAVRGGQKDVFDPAYADDPFVRFVDELLPDSPFKFLQATGVGTYGWSHVEALRIADELEGGLTRSNFMLAMRALRLEHPMLIDGVAFGVNGNADAYYIEGSDITVFDAQQLRWIIQEVVDVDGQTPNCAWDTESGQCIGYGAGDIEPHACEDSDSGSDSGSDSDS
jgi:ABC-type branched-subunit amino acid transport system substrate-binding protein